MSISAQILMYGCNVHFYRVWLKHLTHKRQIYSSPQLIIPTKLTSRVKKYILINEDIFKILQGVRNAQSMEENVLTRRYVTSKPLLNTQAALKLFLKCNKLGFAWI